MEKYKLQIIIFLFINKFLKIQILIITANFNEVAVCDKDKKIKDLKKKNEEADLELKELEKSYLAKMSKLLLYSHFVSYYYIK